MSNLNNSYTMYSPQELEDLKEAYSVCNHTELYQLCRRKGLKVPPYSTNEDYIEWLIGHKPPPEDNIVDAWRDGLIAFITKYWRTLRPQLTCPAKNLKDVPEPDPRPCYGCTDLQVINCGTKSPQYEKEIRRLGNADK